VCSFGTADRSDRRRRSWKSYFSKFDINALVTQEFHHCAPMEASLPVSPQNGMQGRKRRWESNDFLGCLAWPEHCAHAARFLGSCSISLTFLTPRAGTAVPDSSSIDDAHTAVSFRTALMRIERETGRTV
jgi:hypothetical protein